MASDEERFSEKDIRKIIHRALEIQSRGAGSRIPASGGAGGYTLGDLEAVARDLGIQPALIRQAAVDISASQLSKAGRWFLGADPKVDSTGFIDRETVGDRLQELNTALPHLAEGFGMGTVSRSTLSWSSSTAESMRRGYSTEVSVTSSGGVTTATVRERLGGVAGGVFGGMMGGLGLGGGLGVGVGYGIGELGSPIFAVSVAVGVLAFAYLVARTIFTLTVRARKKKTAALLGRILEFLDEHSAPKE